MDDNQWNDTCSKSKMTTYEHEKGPWSIVIINSKQVLAQREKVFSPKVNFFFKNFKKANPEFL